jgi:hypothetical protein
MAAILLQKRRRDASARHSPLVGSYVSFWHHAQITHA